MKRSSRKALFITVLAVTSTATGVAQADKPPSLFADEIGQPQGQLPSQAIAGKSRTVKINHGHLRSRRLMLSLPGGMKVGAIRDREEDLGNGRFAWVGHAIGNRAERVILGVSGDAVAGTFFRKGKLFKLEPRTDGSHILSEVGTTEPAPELDPVPVDDIYHPTAGGRLTSGDTAVTADAVLTLGGAAEADAGQPIIDVLVAYTPRVQDIYGTAGTEALIIQAVAETNQAYANSGIHQRINLVYTVPTNYTESGDAPTDLGRLRSNADGYVDELHALRDSYGADQVVMLIKGGRYCGYAYRMSTLSAGFASSAFSIVRHDCATGYYTFAHELGHNQGAHHDTANSGTAIYDYAHGYQDPSNGFRTVMAYSCDSGCTRVDHFSNPAIYYNNAPTGDASDANNTRTLNNTAATVASFRAQVQQQAPEPPSGLEAEAASDSEIRLNWVDASTNESGFYLERAGSNQNFVQIASVTTNTTSYLDDNLQANTLYYYRTRAFNSGGSSSYSNTAITATDPPPPAPVPDAPSGLNAIPAGTDSIALEWTDNSTNESGFTLQRSPNGAGGWANIATLAANARSHLDTGLQAGTAYYYRVRAYNESGASNYSNKSSGQTEEAPAPRNLRQRDFFR